MKTVFIICGPESSGNRLTRMILKSIPILEVGNDYERAMRMFEEKRDIDLMKENTWLFAGRSIPHGGTFGNREKVPEYLSLDKYEKAFINFGFKPKWIIPIRSIYPLMKSKMARKRTPIGVRENDAAMYQFISGQYLHIFSGLVDIGDAIFHLFNTSALMLNPDRELMGLEKFFGFELDIKRIKKEIYDADAKHYER